MNIGIAREELSRGGCLGVDLSNVRHKKVANRISATETIVEVPATTDAEGRLVPSSVTGQTKISVNEPLLLEECVALVTGESAG